MARIRSIKPEFCVSETLNECSVSARCLFILMWMFCDDAGNHPAKLVQLKAECFPCDPFSRDDMQSMISELINAGVLIEYLGSDGAMYWHVKSWHHQVINRPTPSKWPAFTEDSVSTHVPLSEDSRLERKGRERKGVLKERSTSVDPKKADEIGPCASDLKASAKDPKHPKEAKPPKRATSRAQAPPTIEEVAARIAERGLSLDAEEFHAYYQARGWTLNRGQPIKDWDACLTTWAKRQPKFESAESTKARERETYQRALAAEESRRIAREQAESRERHGPIALITAEQSTDKPLFAKPPDEPKELSPEQFTKQLATHMQSLENRK